MCKRKIEKVILREKKRIQDSECLEDRIRRSMNNKKKEAKKLQQVLVCIHKSKKKEKKRKRTAEEDKGKIWKIY